MSAPATGLTPHVHQLQSPPGHRGKESRGRALAIEASALVCLGNQVWAWPGSSPLPTPPSPWRTAGLLWTERPFTRALQEPQVSPNSFQAGPEISPRVREAWWVSAIPPRLSPNAQGPSGMSWAPPPPPPLQAPSPASGWRTHPTSSTEGLTIEKRQPQCCHPCWTPGIGPKSSLHPTPRKQATREAVLLGL